MLFRAKNLHPALTSVSVLCVKNSAHLCAETNTGSDRVSTTDVSNGRSESEKFATMLETRSPPQRLHLLLLYHRHTTTIV